MSWQGFWGTVGYLAGMLGWLAAIPAALCLLGSWWTGIVHMRRSLAAGEAGLRSHATYFVVAGFWAVLLATPVDLLVFSNGDHLNQRIAIAAVILGSFYLIPFKLVRLPASVAGVS